MIRKISQIAIVMIILAVPRLAQAQIFTNPIYNPWVSPIPNLGIQAQIDERNRLRNNREKPSKSSSAKLSSSKLTYKPSAVIRRANLKKIVEKTRQTNSESAVQLEQLFTAQDVIGQINQGMEKVGLKPNNVADAYALYWVTAWLGSHGRTGNFPKSQMMGVRSQATEALLKVPEFTSATDTQKQELTEAMLIQAALIEASIDYAKADPAILNKVKTAIAQGAKAFGLDLDSMTLTAQGFRPVSK